MILNMFTFKSDYLQEKVLSLENSLLLSSRIPKTFPRVFFTRDINSDSDCEIMVIEVFKKESLTNKIKNKKAKTVIVTTTPMASFDFFVNSGMKCSYVLMEQNKIIEASEDLRVSKKEEEGDISGRKCSNATKNSLLNYTSHRYNRLLNPYDVVLNTIYSQEERTLNSIELMTWGLFPEYSDSYFQKDLNQHFPVCCTPAANLDLVKRRVMNMRKRFSEKGTISPETLTALRENFLISQLENQNDAASLASSPPHIECYGKLQRIYNLKKALKKIVDQRRFTSKFERMRKRVCYSKNLPCSFNSHKISRLRYSSEYYVDDSSPDSESTPFVVETSENNFSVFNSEDGLVKIKKVVSSIIRKSKKTNLIFNRRNSRKKNVQKFFKPKEFENLDSDVDSI